MRVLVTGGAGFIGSNLVRHILLHRPDWEVTNFDKLTYAGNSENLADLGETPRHRFVRGDVADREAVERLFEGGFDLVMHLAAESHVDRSIGDPQVFVRTNVLGTQTLLDVARKRGVGRFLHVSTDEVYGSLGEEGRWTEASPLAPSSPYSASKAGADLLALAYHRTFGLPVIITRCSNNYGPYQFPEKLIPLTITNVLEGKLVPVYGTGRNVRDWLHVEDHCRALLLVAEQGSPGEVYHVAGDDERRNLEVVQAILRELGVPHEPGQPGCPIRFVPDRPGHDWRYALDAGKIRRELGWRADVPFAEGLRATVRWYVEHRGWWERVRSGRYQAHG